MKVPWPMSDREALLHYFELEYLEDDLLIVLMKTVGSPVRLGWSSSVLFSPEKLVVIFIFFLTPVDFLLLRMLVCLLFLCIIFSQIPDGEPIDPSNHGFEKDGIPEANDSVRVDLVGGFVLQKISPTRCYFR